MRKSTASFFMLAVTVVTAAALWTWPVEQWETVNTTVVSLGDVQRTISVTGTAARKGEYYSAHPKGGVVVQVYVQEGQSVIAGQPLFRLDDSLQQAALKNVIQAMENTKSSQAAWMDQASLAVASLGENAQALAQSGLEAYDGTMAGLVNQMELLKSEIEGLTQRAYKDGQVLQIIAREGELLLPGTPGAVLSSVDAEVRAVVSSRDSQQIREGMRAVISINSIPLGDALVESVGLLKPNSQGVPYSQVVFTPLNGLSVPIGTVVDVDVILEEQNQVPVVPVEAITDKDTVFQVYQGRAWELNAVIQSWDGNMVAVRGLEVGTEVVLSPGTDLKNGIRLKVVNP